MNLVYEVLPLERADECREICNELMAFQKSKAHIAPERFDTMNFDTRMLPSIEKAIHNYLVVVKHEEQIIGYVYSNVSPKQAYSNDFATFFDMDSVAKRNVGCLSQFYIKDGYRQYGVGSELLS